MQLRKESSHGGLESDDAEEIHTLPALLPGTQVMLIAINLNQGISHIRDGEFLTSDAHIIILEGLMELF